jgi:hypothetical protein
MGWGCPRITHLEQAAGRRGENFAVRPSRPRGAPYLQGRRNAHAYFTALRTLRVRGQPLQHALSWPVQYSGTIYRIVCDAAHERARQYRLQVFRPVRRKGEKAVNFGVAFVAFGGACQTEGVVGLREST